MRNDRAVCARCAMEAMKLEVASLSTLSVRRGSCPRCPTQKKPALLYSVARR